MAKVQMIEGAPGFEAFIGRELGTSEWITVDQRMIDDFARTTGDEQWIHVDPARAALGPFGTTIAHGYLVLSLIPVLANQVYDVLGFSARVNYGLEKVRFPAPLRSGDRVRDRVSIVSVDETPSGTRVTFAHQLDSDTGGRPVCVAQTLILFKA
ncbi:MaoC family dehydratase [Diaminobutyricibacter sp. McL0618]|uniref:MaoC family dehydratase n=1 Tax=Leifsonia sp. McL0618 TaxID=3415677 RepID=UPI003CEEE803